MFIHPSILKEGWNNSTSGLRSNWKLHQHAVAEACTLYPSLGSDIICSSNVSSRLPSTSSSPVPSWGSCPVKVHWDQLVVPGLWSGSGVEWCLPKPLPLWLLVLVILKMLSLCLPGVSKVGPLRGISLWLFVQGISDASCAILLNLEIYSSISGHVIFSVCNSILALCAFWKSIKQFQKFCTNRWQVALLSSAGWSVSSHSSCCSVHWLTSGPLLHVRVMVILCMKEASAGTSWLTSR